jgi:transcriptional regulator with XRE-family HTH domain
MKHPPSQAFGPGVNRIRDVMLHAQRYQFHGVVRLAADTGLSHSTVSRLLSGHKQPTAKVLGRITEALERALGTRIDPRDLFAESGRFPTRFACDLVACRGCLPDAATDEFGSRKKTFDGIRPGQWVSSRHPRGYGVTEPGGSDD